MSAISLGLGARGLKDKDFFTKSDPFCVISRPSINGGFNVVRISETRKNTLNPDWSDFLFKAEEVSGNDMNLNLKIAIWDDDGKKGMDKKDDLLGEGCFSLKQLEAASLVETGLKLFDGKRQKHCGTLIVRSFKVLEDTSTKGQSGKKSAYPNLDSSNPQKSDGASSGYPQGGYPSANSGYPPSSGGYPPSAAYPSAAAGYPPNPAAGGRYPPGPTPYPPNLQSGYPPANPGYPAPAPGGYPANPGYPAMPGYPAAGQPGYPPGGAGQPGYPAGQPGYPAGLPSYPAAGQPSYPAGQPGYPGGPPGGGSGAGFVMPGSNLFPDNNLPAGPGYNQ